MSTLPVGIHEVEVIDHYLAKSAKKGTPCVEVRFSADDGASITWYGYLTYAALDKTVEALERIGWDSVAAAGQVSSLNGTGVLVGKRCQIVVEEEEYNGKWYPKVKWVNRLGEGGSGRIEGEELDAISAKLAAKILAAKGIEAPAGVVTLPQKPSVPLSEQPDDEFDLGSIPF